MPGRRSPQERALGLLARREHSRRELRRKLKSAAEPVEDGEVDTLLDQLDQGGLQSDGRFAQMLVRSRIGQGHGPVRIRAELRQHGIDERAAEAALAEAAPDWPALARSTSQRRHRGAPVDPAERDRRIGFLVRRGFPLGMASAAVGSIAGNTGDQDLAGSED